MSDFFLQLLQILFLSIIHFKKFTVQAEELNNRPIIAILAEKEHHGDSSYIAASYVKFIESAGGRAAFIPTSFDTEKLTKLFSYVNGALFPGGGVNLVSSPYFENALTMYNLAVQANLKGDYFPIWATCLGFETLHVITAGKHDIIGSFSADDITMPLNFTAAARNSRIFKEMPANLFEAFSSEAITYNHHKHGVSPQEYEQNSNLKNGLNILSTNIGKEGKEFVSTVEAFDYPFYGTQWHPEKNNFEFTPREQIPHTKTAILASQYMANFLVNEAKKNGHAFPSEDEENDYLSYNYDVKFTGKNNDSFAQIYELDKPDPCWISSLFHFFKSIVKTEL